MPGTLATICKLNSRVLQADFEHFGVNADAYKFLLALSGNESSFGHNTKPRHEAAYDVGGKYHNPKFDAIEWRMDWIPNPCAFSYSSFQMMFYVAHELGYDGSWSYLSGAWRPAVKQPIPDPPLSGPNYDWKFLEHLDSNSPDWITCPLVCLYLRERGLEKGAKSLEDLFDCYNSGRANDANIPHEYIKQGMDYYVQDVKWLENQIA